VTEKMDEGLRCGTEEVIVYFKLLIPYCLGGMRKTTT
jgi:hypothetical protein